MEVTFPGSTLGKFERCDRPENRLQDDDDRCQASTVRNPIAANAVGT